MIDTHEEAHRLHRAGLPITLCQPGSKIPLGDDWSVERNGFGWQKKRWTLKEIDRAFKERGQLNVGVLFGPRSGLIDIEEDSPADRAAIAALFDGCPPDVTAVFNSARGPHRLFRWDPALERVGKAVAHFQGLEIRIGAGGKGAHSAFPPSITNGFVREWVNPLEEVPAAQLPQLVLDRIIAANHAVGSTDVMEHVAHRVHRPLLVSSVFSVCQEPRDDDARVLVQAAIKDTLPTDEGHRHRCIFNFARRLKAVPALANVPVEDLRPYVEWWHGLALPKITTKPFEETWYDFRNAWKRVRIPAGSGPLVDTFARAVSQTPPDCANRYEQQQLRSLVALCRELQRVAGNNSFFLAGRAAANLIGVGHRVAARWLRMLCMDDVLTLIERGALHRASAYRYLGD